MEPPPLLTTAFIYVKVQSQMAGHPLMATYWPVYVYLYVCMYVLACLLLQQLD